MVDKKFEKRKLQMLKAIEENPKDKENHLILAKFYFVNEYFPETIEVYKKLLEYYPKDVSIMQNLAMVYHANKQDNDAKQVYLKILKIDPSNKEAQDGLTKITTFK
jgi:tetratricopeptide (TPR) repeat protein